MAKRVFITGASEGIGRAFSHKLAALGFSTTLVARNESRLQELISEFQNRYPNSTHDYLVADLALEEGISHCEKYLSNKHYDLLINNAGFSTFGLYEQADIRNEINILNVNCQAVMRLCHAYLQSAKSGDGIINLSSLTYYLPTPIQPTYVASKNFIASFSESLWFQQREKGIYVQALCPGVTKTEFISRSSTLDGSKKQFLDAISQSADQVVAISLKALEKRKGPIVIPGIANKLLALLINLSPRKLWIYLMGKAGQFALT